MEKIKALIYSFTTFAIIFNAIHVYLMLSQLWKQKNSRQVSLSISLQGTSIALFTTTIWGIYFILEEQWLAIINQVLWISLFFCQGLVAMGFWVQEERKKGLCQMMKDRVKQR